MLRKRRSPHSRSWPLHCSTWSSCITDIRFCNCEKHPDTYVTLGSITLDTHVIWTGSGSATSAAARDVPGDVVLGEVEDLEDD